MTEVNITLDLMDVKALMEAGETGFITYEGKQGTLTKIDATKNSVVYFAAGVATVLEVPTTGNAVIGFLLQ